jgi:hypothetical protein
VFGVSSLLANITECLRLLCSCSLLCFTHCRLLNSQLSLIAATSRLWLTLQLLDVSTAAAPVAHALLLPKHTLHCGGIVSGACVQPCYMTVGCTASAQSDRHMLRVAVMVAGVGLNCASIPALS